MRIFISTGEVSGDLQGALLVEALKRQAAAIGLDLEIVALGGDRMKAAGATLIGNTTAIGSVGIFESLPFLFSSWKIQQKAKQYLQENPPDLVVLIDYLGPNIGIGNHIRQRFPTVPIVYYIGPQEWVWSSRLVSNTANIAKISDRLFAIFQGEADYYQQQGIEVSWVGHPLLDRIKTAPTREEARQILGIKPNETAIALLPASRKQEIKYLLPVIFKAARKLQNELDNAHFYIPISLSNYGSAIELGIKKYGLNATILDGKTLDAIAASDLAITKSGTVNLEIALLNVPQVVLYKVNPATAWIARNLLKFSIPFMSPPNLVVMREIVPELLQEEATPERIVQESLALLLNPDKRKQTLADYREMRQDLGELGVCDRVSAEILSMISV